MAGSPHIIDPVFTAAGKHENAKRLRETLQCRIDEAEAHGGYDAVLLGYGLCGNSTAGIKSRSIPLVIPRAHDCCTIFLGSRKKFAEYFSGNLSAEWSTAGYMERAKSYLRETETGKLLGIDKTYEEYVEMYGEENAAYLWETLHPKAHSSELIYINVPETSHLGFLEKMRSLAAEQGKPLRVITGDMRLIRGLVYGEWNEDDYLIVPAGKEIKPVYDQDKIITFDS